MKEQYNALLIKAFREVVYLYDNQRAAAEILGWHETALSHKLKGDRIPTFVEIGTLAQNLGLSFSLSFHELDYKFKPFE